MEGEKGGKRKGLAEKMAEKFESLETKKKSLRNSIFSAFSEWKGFEVKIASAQNCFRDGLSQLESKEKELDSERESLKKKLQQIEDKEKEFKLFSERGMAKLKKEREDFCKEVEVREANFREREKRLEDLLKKGERIVHASSAMLQEGTLQQAPVHQHNQKPEGSGSS